MPRYVILSPETGKPVAIDEDRVSQEVLFALIERRLGLCRTCAQALLDDGKMLGGNGLLVTREDYLHLAAH
jgi:hypothetical protein